MTIRNVQIDLKSQVDENFIAEKSQVDGKIQISIKKSTWRKIAFLEKVKLT